MKGNKESGSADGKVTLGTIRFYHYPITQKTYVQNEVGKIVEIGQFEKPENIASFKQIQISHFDAYVLDYCKKLGPLLSDVNLKFVSDDPGRNGWTNMGIVLNKLWLPLVDRVRSISFVGVHDCHFFDWAFNQPAFQAVAARTNTMSFMHPPDETFFNFVPQWLTAERAGNAPRLVMITTPCYGLYSALTEAIKKDFLGATTPSSFAVYLKCLRKQKCCEYSFDYHVANSQFQLENGPTKEQLVCRRVENVDSYSLLEFPAGILIRRHKLGADAEFQDWLKECEKLVWQEFSICTDKLIQMKTPTIGIGELNEEQVKESGSADGKVTLGIIRFCKHPSTKKTCVQNEVGKTIEIGQFEKPENIASFKQIQIFHFDAYVLDYCKKLGPLLSDVNLKFVSDDPGRNGWTNMGIVLNKLWLPLVDRVRSISFVGVHDCHFFDWAFNQPAFKAVAARTNTMSFMHPPDETFFNFVPQWLTAERAGNAPRLVVITTPCYGLYSALTEAIVKDFLGATTPSSFAVYLKCLPTQKCCKYSFDYHVTNSQFRMEKGGTKELLVCQRVENGSSDKKCRLEFPAGIQILRHKLGEDTEFQDWLKKCEELVWQEFSISTDKLIQMKTPTIKKRGNKCKCSVL